MKSFQHVLVATDFGPASERALETATEIATQFDAKLTLLHVVQSVAYAYPVAHPPPVTISPSEDRRERATRRIEAAVAATRERRPDARGVVREGVPSREIVDAAAELGADLVVVGSNGRRGLPHWMLGSVAERVLAVSAVPVLTVRAFRFEDRADAGRRLAHALASTKEAAPAVVALSRGGIPVAAEIAEFFDASIDLLSTRPALFEDLEALSGMNATADLRGRAVILVNDEIGDPWRALVAADAARKMGARRVIVAAPVATDGALAALRAEVADVVVLEALRDDMEPAAAYRAFREPSERTLVKRLRGRGPTRREASSARRDRPSARELEPARTPVPGS